MHVPRADGTNDGLTIAQAEARASKILGASVRAIRSDYPEMAVNVDRPGDVALAEALAREAHVLYWVGAVVSLAVLAATFFSGAAAHVRNLLERRIRHPFALAATYIALLMLALSLLSLPLEFYGSFTMSHRFGLSDETVARWLRDWSVGAAIDAGIAGVIGAGLLRVIACYRRWAFIAALVAGQLIFFGSAIYPLWIAPLFNAYRPLPPSHLSNAILALAHEQGLNASVVYEYDMSAQTHEANAYVAGLGQTERIAVGDTLLRGLKPDEVLYVMAHEIGHYSSNIGGSDRWKAGPERLSRSRGWPSPAMPLCVATRDARAR